MKANKITVFAVAILAFASLWGIPGRALAGVAVSPLKQEISVKPGQTERFQITVTNNARDSMARAETAYLSLTDVAVSEEGRLSFMRPGSLPQSASRWITLDSTEVVLEPGQSKVVEGTITAPYNPSGEFYSAVMVTLGRQGETGEGLSVTYRIASGLFVTVAGGAPQKRAQITRCEVVWPRSDEPSVTTGSQPAAELAALTPSPPASFKPAKVSVVLKNAGQARFDASGRVRILNMQSKTVFSATLTSVRPCVFGGDSRLFEAVLDKPVPAGRYMLHVEMDYGSPWGKARRQQLLDITPEQALLIGQTAGRAEQRQGGTIEVEQEGLYCAVMAGSFRCLSVTVRNSGPETVLCSAALTAKEGGSPGEARWSVEPSRFELPPGARRSLVLRLTVPTEAAAGRYSYSLAIDAARADAPEAKCSVPVEIDVKSR